MTTEVSTQTTAGTAGTTGGQTPVQTSQATSTPPTGTQAATSATDAQQTGEQTTPPAYTPNYKYKAFQKEMELDPFWHPLIKDQESEKKVKDVFTRADAFDDMKSRFEGTQSEFSQIYNEYQALDQDVRRVTSFLNKGDLDNFFSSIGLDQNKVFQWVSQKLEQESLPPDQKRALEAQQKERQRLYDLEHQNSTLEEQFQTQASQARGMQLDMTLSRPDVSKAASLWDSRMGRIGAFRDLVITEAQNAWHVQKTDLSAEQAVQAVLEKYGKVIEGLGLAPQNAMASQNATSQAQVQPPQAADKPVIPAVQGRGTSPVKKSPKSIEDLKQMAKEMGA